MSLGNFAGSWHRERGFVSSDQVWEGGGNSSEGWRPAGGFVGFVELVGSGGGSHHPWGCPENLWTWPSLLCFGFKVGIHAGFDLGGLFRPQ